MTPIYIYINHPTGGLEGNPQVSPFQFGRIGVHMLLVSLMIRLAFGGVWLTQRRCMLRMFLTADVANHFGCCFVRVLLLVPTCPFFRIHSPRTSRAFLLHDMCEDWWGSAGSACLRLPRRQWVWHDGSNGSDLYG